MKFCSKKWIAFSELVFVFDNDEAIDVDPIQMSDLITTIGGRVDAFQDDGAASFADFFNLNFEEYIKDKVIRKSIHTFLD